MIISGLLESEKEEMKSVVIKFLAEILDVPNSDLAQAFCIETIGIQPRVIIVKFHD